MALELKNVVKKVGAETHIYETSLSLEKGGFNILLGTTLSGKTTLMQLMAGIEKPTSGEVWFDGEDVTGVSVQKRNLSMVYQQFINYPNFSVYDNIASPLRVAGVKRNVIRERVGQIAELLKLSPYLDRKPAELSGGQQQRTALARALIKDADLILLDEPLANLDFKLREELRDELPRLFMDRQCTVVYATTEPSEALLLAGHTATLHEGRVTQFGETGDVYRKPHDLLTANVFSDPPINSAEVIKQGEDIVLNDTVKWSSELVNTPLADGKYMMAVRPHHIVPASNGGNGTRFDGSVQIAELSGSESVIHFDVKGLSWVSQFHGVRAYDIDETVTFSLDVSKCMYFDESGKFVAAGRG